MSTSWGSHKQEIKEALHNCSQGGSRPQWEGKVFVALGMASACWDNLSGAGVFDSTRAKEIGEALIEVLKEDLQGAS